jgi:recombination associated protein RdgC
MSSFLKNIIIYRIAPTWVPDTAQIEASLDAARYVACGASQEKSIGWTEPRGEAHGVLIESVSGQLMLKLMIETKSVPSAVINRKALEEITNRSALTGRKPGKSETKEIKEDIKLALMPLAFTKISSTVVWIDPTARLLIIDAASQSKADEIITQLVRCIDGFSILPLNGQTSCAAAMSAWLSNQEAPNNFSIDRECELKSTDETKSVVKYSRHALDLDEVTQHIASGKVPTKLALTWNGRVSFVLTDTMHTLHLRKLTFLEGVFDGASENSENKADRFDADVAIATGELSLLIPDLLEALGGVLEGVPEVPDAKPAKNSTVPTTEPTHSDVSGVSYVNEPDPMYDQAVALVLKEHKASISLLQRHLQIGYNRAARLVEDMEKAGVVSSMNSSGQRRILTAAL